MSEDLPPPVPTGVVKDVFLQELINCCFAWNVLDDQPVFIRMANSPDLFLALFSDVENLKALYKAISVPFDGIKKILDGHEFIESIPRKVGEMSVRIILNPYLHGNGKVRYTQLTTN